MNPHDPIPARGNVSLTSAVVLQASVMRTATGEPVAGRVFVYKPDAAAVDGRNVLDSTIIGVDPDHLDRLAACLQEAAAMMRRELGAQAVAALGHQAGPTAVQP